MRDAAGQDMRDAAGQDMRDASAMRSGGGDGGGRVGGDAGGDNSIVAASRRAQSVPVTERVNRVLAEWREQIIYDSNEEHTGGCSTITRLHERYAAITHCTLDTITLTLYSYTIGDTILIPYTFDAPYIHLTLYSYTKGDTIRIPYTFHTIHIPYTLGGARSRNRSCRS
jgi:hypothetical protein